MSTQDKPVPTSPTLNLEHLRKQAKDLKKAWNAGAQDAQDLVRGYLRPLRQQKLENAGQCSLRDCQFVIARRYGFHSWQALQEQAAGGLDASLSAADRFALLACLAYDSQDHPEQWAEAEGLFSSQPAIVQHLAAAAAAGDSAQVKQLIGKDPQAIHAPTGPKAWPPLLYACYSRVQLPGHSTAQVIKDLLTAGADPNCHYLWANRYRFSALTGVIGGGESGMIRQPPHPDCDSLARLLLQAGANANDGQSIYNRLVCQDWSMLDLLAQYGLTATDRLDWQEDGQTTLHYILCWAAERGHMELVAWALDQDSNIDEDGPHDSPLYLALTNGHAALAELLRHRGAKEPVLSELEQLKAACATGATVDRDLAIQHQDALQDLIIKAAREGDCSKLGYFFDLGLSMNKGAVRPLHQAAWHIQAETIDWLVAHGADPHARDDHYQGKAIDWLNHKLAGDEQASQDEQAQACRAALESAMQETAMQETVIQATASQESADTNAKAWNYSRKELHRSIKAGRLAAYLQQFSPDDLAKASPLGLSIVVDAANAASPQVLQELQAAKAIFDLFGAAAWGLCDHIRDGFDGNIEDLHEQRQAGRTPLDTALYFGQVEAAALLKELGYDRPITIQGYDDAAIHWAVEHGADPNGGLSLHHQAKHGRIRGVAALLACGADPCLGDDAGNTPLHLLAQTGVGQTFAALLLQHGAQVDARNAAGMTPLAIAKAAKRQSLYTYLSTHSPE